MSKISLDEREECLKKRKVKHSGLDNPQSLLDGLNIRGSIDKLR